MGGSGQHSTLEDGSASARFDEVELAMEADFILDAEPPVEIQQVDATVQQNVLAVVDHLRVVTAHGPGRRPAAEEIARFVDIDFESRAAQGNG